MSNYELRRFIESLVKRCDEMEVTAGILLGQAQRQRKELAMMQALIVAEPARMNGESSTGNLRYEAPPLAVLLRQGLGGRS